MALNIHTTRNDILQPKSALWEDKKSFQRINIFHYYPGYQKYIYIQVADSKYVSGQNMPFDINSTFTIAFIF